MELVEREQFLQELEAIFTDVVGGHGRFVLVSGEAGIGKTSLIDRFTDTHHNQARILWGACDALFTPRALGPLYDIAPQTQSNLFTLLEEEAPRTSILSAVLEELEKNTKPTIVVIEDVHWADEATLDLIKFLGRRMSKVKSMLIVSYRDDEVGLDHPLRLVLGDLPSRSVSRVRLPHLSITGVKMLADRAGRRIEDLHTLTGGNPFFVTEVLSSNESGVPVTVSDAVLSRAQRLSHAAREVLELVSVVPARAELWLINEAIGPTTVALEECLNAGMLQSEDEALAFRHELARRATEDSLAIPRRQTLHGLILKALLNRKSEAMLARIVHHATQAGDEKAVLEYAPIAARQAAALNAHRESASHYQTALKYANELPPEERAVLLENRSYELHITDQNEQALEARREAFEVWTKLGDKRRQGANLRWMSRLAWFLSNKEEAESYGLAAVTILETLTPSPELALAYSNRAQLHMLADECQEAVLWGSRAIELAERLGATETLVHALNNVGSAELFLRDEKGRIKLEESLRLALANDLQDSAARAFTNLVDYAVRDKDYPLAMRYLDDLIAYSTERGLEARTIYIIGSRARVYLEQGDWGKAAEDAAFVLGQYRLSAITRIPALAVLAQVRIRRGDPNVEPLLTEGRDLALKSGEPQRIAPVTAARAEFAWLKGNLEQVVNEAQAVLAMPRVAEDPWVFGEFAFWIWRAGGTPPAHGRIASPYALHMSGDWRGAANAWKEIGCPYEQAVALADGDEPAQREALEIFEQLGAGPAAEKLRQTLRATGARGLRRGPRPSTKENPSGLTNRQLEVLALMADGLGNADIGERLFISSKTVDHHVSAILSKLDAKTRGEAVAMASQAGLIEQTSRAKK